MLDPQILSPTSKVCTSCAANNDRRRSESEYLYRAIQVLSESTSVRDSRSNANRLCSAGSDNLRIPRMELLHSMQRPYAGCSTRHSDLVHNIALLSPMASAGVSLDVKLPYVHTNV